MTGAPFDNLRGFRYAQDERLWHFPFVLSPSTLRFVRLETPFRKSTATNRSS